MATPGTKEFAKRYASIREGDIVSFKHRGFLVGSKKPKMATLYRLRDDLTWEDVTHNWKEQKPSFTGIFYSLILFRFYVFIHFHAALPTRKSTKKRRRPPGYWRNKENRRKFFEDFARAERFDSKDVNKWMSITVDEFKNHVIIYFIRCCSRYWFFA